MKKFISVAFAIVIAAMLTTCMHTHTWEDATCTAPKTCSECGETEGEPLDHTWQEATCTEPKTCSLCGETEGEPLGHIVESWSIGKDATCAAEGEEIGTCSRCNTTVQKPIPKLPHTPGELTVTKNATDTLPGQKTQSCTVCGQVLKTENFMLSTEEVEEQYKASCTTYDYNTIARNPDEYISTYGKYTGQIIQVLEYMNNLKLRVNITLDEYGYYDDTIYVTYTLKEGESRLLENDIVTIYGMNMGTISYESVLGATITIPYVDAEYIELN